MRQPMRKVITNLPVVLVEDVDDFGNTRGMNRSEVIRAALRDFMEREKRKAVMNQCNPPTSIATLKPQAPST